jgi:hypothetical protein
VLLLAAALLLCACSAGKEFALPPSGSLTLGKTTPEQVIAMLGEPLQRSSSATADEKSDMAAPPSQTFAPAREAGRYDRFSYAYIKQGNPHLMDTGARLFACTFWNGKLVSYLGSSSFAAEATDFDDAKVDRLARGKTTAADVLAMFGKPTGGAVYPIISRPDGAALIYFYQLDDVSNNERRTKFLEVYFDGAGVVRDFRANSSTTPLPTAPAAPAPVPIILPTGKR